MRLWLILVLVLAVMSPGIVHANGYGMALEFIKKAQQYLDIADYNEALKQLDEAAYHNDGYGYYGYICFLKGQTYHKLGDPIKAKEFYEQSLKYGVVCKCGLEEPGASVQKKDILALIGSIDATSEGAGKNAKKKPPSPAKKRDSHFLFVGKNDHVEIHSTFYSPYAALFPGKGIPCPLHKRKYRDQILENKKNKEFIKSEILIPVCTVGIGDDLIAYGPGWSKKVKINDFDIVIEPGFDMDELYVRGTIEKLPEEPLFFSTLLIDPLDTKVQQARLIDNDQFTVPKDINNVLSNLSPKWKKKTVKVYSYPSQKNTSFLVHFNAEGFVETSRVALNLDLLYFVENGSSTRLLNIQSDDYYGRDCIQKISVTSTVDFDGDNDLDIFVQTTNGAILIEKKALGFHTYQWAEKPCTL